MARNIIILFDGTSNEISATRSNVLRLYGCLARSDTQIVWYDPGVGTFGARNGSRAASVWRTLKGLAFASGLEDNVLEAYRFLMDIWQEGDKVSLFGFSRGAYTARVLAGFIHAMGLLHREQSNMVEYAYRAYHRIPVQGGTHASLERQRDNSESEIRLYRKALKPRTIPLHFLGLWDTVSSYLDIRAWRWTTHPFTDANPDVAIVRHALAIDELRFMFRHMPWQASLGVPLRGEVVQDAREVWFAGSHSDVGGGYTEDESRLVKVPLVWMLGEARKAGIALDDEAITTVVLGEDPESPKYVRPDAKAPIKGSMIAGWRWIEWLAIVRDKRSNGTERLAWRPFTPRPIEPGSFIHSSAVERRDSDRSYRPANWPETFETED